MRDNEWSSLVLLQDCVITTSVYVRRNYSVLMMASAWGESIHAFIENTTRSIISIISNRRRRRRQKVVMIHRHHYSAMLLLLLIAMTADTLP